MSVHRARVATVLGLGVTVLALGALVAAGACKRAPDAPAGSGAGPGGTATGTGAASSAPPLPTADEVVYTCEVSVIDRSATPFAQAEAWAPDEAAARARAVPEACRRAGGAADCGGEEGGWETATACVPSVEATPEGGDQQGWSCVATAVLGGVARVLAESPRGVAAACELAHAAACKVAGGGEPCRTLRGGWQVFDRVRGKKVKTPE